MAVMADMVEVVFVRGTDVSKMPRQAGPTFWSSTCLYAQQSKARWFILPSVDHHGNALRWKVHTVLGDVAYTADVYEVAEMWAMMND